MKPNGPKQRRLPLAAYVVFFFLCCCTESGVAAAPATPTQLVQGLREGHPRLVTSATDIAQLRMLVQENQQAGELYASFQKAAKELEASSPVFFPARGNKLGRSRKLLSRVYLLGVLSQLTEDSALRRNYSAQVWRQLQPALKAESWTTGRTPFLAVGETMHALAIAYDWFYSDFSEDQRSAIRDSLIHNGLERYVAGVADGKEWNTKQGNWAFVCHGGAALAALAIAEHDPDIAEKVLETAIPAISTALQSFSPDGAWWEGLTYWGYATRYATYALAGMTTSMGHDLGLAEERGLAESGLFAIYATGPSGLVFNYADSDDTVGDENQMFWLGKRFDQPIYAWFQREHFVNDLLRRIQGKESVLAELERDPRPYALNLLWYSPSGSAQDLEGLPRVRIFRAKDVEIGVLRSGWQKDDLYLGVKGGLSNAGHAHLDLGSFVLDARGYRWAVDLGKDDYQIPGYWDSKGGRRWDIYRLSSRGHNTFLVDGGNQSAGAFAHVQGSFDDAERPVVLVDLTAAQSARGVRSASRSFALDMAGQSVEIVDRLETEKPLSYEWIMHTPANAEVDGSRVVLEQRGERMIVRLLQPGGVTFRAEPANPGTRPAGQAPNDGITRLSFRRNIAPGQVAEIHVLISGE